MKPIFYFGSRLGASLAIALANAGHPATRFPYEQGLRELQCGSPCSTVLLEWRSARDQRVIEEAKARGIPVLVLTSKLAAAALAAPSADVYLELPCADQEVVDFALDLVIGRPLKRLAAAVGRVHALAGSENVSASCPQGCPQRLETTGPTAFVLLGASALPDRESRTHSHRPSHAPNNAALPIRGN